MVMSMDRQRENTGNVYGGLVVVRELRVMGKSAVFSGEQRETPASKRSR